jgi:hypothetical protein
LLYALLHVDSIYSASKRAGSKPLAKVLSFEQYKARFGSKQGNSQPPRYDPASENFPDDEWYALEHDKINNGFHDLCSDILQLVHNHNPNDTEVSNLNTALKSANTIPRGQNFYVAFLGEQGMGKSWLFNAVFNRDFVNVSSSSSACTAFPTIITHKHGVEDDTDESDFSIECFNEEEIRDCIDEQCRRYRYAFPRKAPVEHAYEDDQTSDVECPLSGDEDKANEEEEEEKEIEDEDEEEVDNAAQEDDEDEDQNQDGKEDEMSDEEEEDFVFGLHSHDHIQHGHRKKISATVLRGAKTARTFFDIIFATRNDKARRAYLNHLLENTDIEDDIFSAICIQQTKRRLREIGALDGYSNHYAVRNEDLSCV